MTPAEESSSPRSTGTQWSRFLARSTHLLIALKITPPFKGYWRAGSRDPTYEREGFTTKELFKVRL